MEKENQLQKKREREREARAETRGTRHVSKHLKVARQQHNNNCNGKYTSSTSK